MQQSHPRILINNISYPADKTLFKSVSMAFGLEKTGLIGRNGIGKSTLLRLMAGELQPETGSIQILGKLAYCPQQSDGMSEYSAAQALGVADRLRALARIQAGSTDENDFALIAEDWDIHDRVDNQLKDFGLAHINLSDPLSALSGGERTRLLLAGVFLLQADFIILDEPTNNLDSQARQLLYNAVCAWRKGMLVVSHDRSLLNLMDKTVELTSLGVNTYGGNYDYYQEQKALMKDAAERNAADADKALQKVRASAQTTRERREQKSSQGRKRFLDGKIDKLFARSQQGRSERTQGKQAQMKENLLREAEAKLKQARSKVEALEEIYISLPDTHVPAGKIILDIENLSFSFPGRGQLIQHLSLTLTGPERAALTGPNGCGKSTLVKLILGELNAEQGRIYRGTSRIRCLDQHALTLDPDASLVDNYLRLNPDAVLIDAHAALARFLFRNEAALRLVKHLSGGEKLRAELCCALLAKQPPQLLILDEPTNHLDLDSIAALESALRQYQGAMLVISHDQRFLANIGVQRYISIT